MKFYEYDCEKCGMHIWSPVTEDDHKKNCNGNFEGLVLGGKPPFFQGVRA